MTIAEFLAGRYDEEEAMARAASPGPWHTNAERDEVLAVDDITVAEGFALSGPQTRATTEHIALHDPVRVLADVAAKRAILELHEPRPAHTSPGSAWWQECSVCFDPDTAAGDYDFETWPCPTLRALVQAYDGHPDFDPDWRAQ